MAVQTGAHVGGGCGVLVGPWTRPPLPRAGMLPGARPAPATFMHARARSFRRSRMLGDANMGRIGSWVAALLVAGAFTVAGPSAGPAIAAIDANDYPGQDAVCAATGTVSGWCANSDWRKGGSPYSSRGYAWRNCTDFAAFRANQLAGHTVVPSGWGNANAWDEHARAAGLAVDGAPQVGDIAQSDAGTFGHVAIVAQIGSGQVRLEEYNHTKPGDPNYYDGLYYNNRWVSSPAYEYIHTGASSSVTEGSLVSYQGNVYRIAGGAPIYVSSWDAVGGEQQATPISDAQFANLNPMPADGTLVYVKAGPVFRIAGGAPIYVSNWDALGGPQVSTLIDQMAIDHAGEGDVWTHLNRFPEDGTILNALAGSVSFRVSNGTPLRIARTGGILVEGAALDRAGMAFPWNHLRSSTPHARLQAISGRTRLDHITLSWQGLITASRTTSYDVRWRIPTRTWHLPSGWQKLSSGPVRLTGLRVGTTYCFSIRARNLARVVGPWAQPICTKRVH